MPASVTVVLNSARRLISKLTPDDRARLHVRRPLDGVVAPRHGIPGHVHRVVVGVMVDIGDLERR